MMYDAEKLMKLLGDINLNLEKYMESGLGKAETLTMITDARVILLQQQSYDNFMLTRVLNADQLLEEMLAQIDHYTDRMDEVEKIKFMENCATELYNRISISMLKKNIG
jgi:hypothetical protein